MPDDIINDTNTDNLDVDNNIDDNQDDVSTQSDSDFMDDTIDYIKDIQRTNIDDDSDDTDNVDIDSYDDTDIDVADLAGTDIPDEFSNVAEAAGMSPQDIIDFANSHSDEELIELIPYLKNSITDVDDTTVDDNIDNNTKADDTTKDINEELEQQIAERIAKQLEEKFGTTLDEINEIKAYQKEQSTKQTVELVSNKFDEAAKEFPIFGKTDELPRFKAGKLAGQFVPTDKSVRARAEVLKYADAFRQLGTDVASAMDNALATYKGKHMEKEMERNLVRDLKKHETKLSGTRTGKETKKNYQDTREEIIDEIRQMQRASGLDI